MGIELAQKLGLQKSFITKYENGRVAAGIPIDATEEISETMAQTEEFFQHETQF